MKPNTIKTYKVIDSADDTWFYISIDSQSSEYNMNDHQARNPTWRFIRATPNKWRTDYRHLSNTKVKRRK